MNTEQEERIQSLLRDSMLLLHNNQGVINLQKILPRLQALQESINKLGNPVDIINFMSIN